MSEPIQIDDLEQLADVIVAITLPLPDGREAVVKLRSLSYEELRSIRRSVIRPKRQVKDYKKLGDEALPIYDDQDEAYKRADDDADLEVASKQLIAALVMTIPGETIADKCRALETKLGRASYIYLSNAVNKINNPTLEEIANVMRSFRRYGEISTAGDGTVGDYPVKVERLIESRSARSAGATASPKRADRAAAE